MDQEDTSSEVTNLEYCAQIWRSHPQKDINGVDLVQRAATQMEFVRLDDEGQHSLLSVEMTADSLQQEIESCKAQYAQMQKDKDDLETARAEAENAAKELKERTQRLSMRTEFAKKESENLELSYQLMIGEAEDETVKLQKIKQDLEAKLQEEAKRTRVLEEEIKISSRPERRMVFKGHMQDVHLSDGIDVIPKVQFPISGGCALITFDEEDVAQKIIEKREHEIQLEECRLRVEARSVELHMPSAIKMQMKFCNKKILISNIPAAEKNDLLLDKLELFFDKRRNGGGEVAEREFLPDSGNVVLTFVDDGVAKELVKKGSFSVPLGSGKTCLLKVTSCLAGEIEDLKFRTSVCRRTVLLTGIPDVMDREPLQVLLKIHFLKHSNGSGEVEALSFVPVGSHAIATFEEDTGSDRCASGDL